jgi:hypothetical protein
MGIALGAWPQNQFCTEEVKPNTGRQSHKYRSSYATAYRMKPGFPLQGKMNSRRFGSEGGTLGYDGTGPFRLERASGYPG